MRRCRICKSFRLRKVFSLGKQPLANKLLAKPKDTKTYPLDLYQCLHCSLLQLGHVVPKEEMFDEYFYIPSVSKTYLKHFDRLALELIKTLKLKKGSLIVDIGGSDGSFLKCFKKRGMRVLNIEPAENITSDVPVLKSYFTKELVNEVVHIYGKAKLVLATNVFAHIDNLHEFLEGLDLLLAKDGVFFAQFPDVRNLLKENQFDTIYHEHLSYFTYEPLHHLFTNTPFELWQVTSDNIHGGSMRIWVRRRQNLLQNFTISVQENTMKIHSYLLREKKKGKRIVGFGAAAKGTVLLNYCGLDNSIVDYVVDGTPYKQNKYIPGVMIPVFPESYLQKIKPDIILILAWNFKEEIIQKLKGKGFTFVVPIPKMEIIKI